MCFARRVYAKSAGGACLFAPPKEPKIHRSAAFQYRYDSLFFPGGGPSKINQVATLFTKSMDAT